ncbi:MAG: MFS transporter [Gammaproteobacteria bacterium]|jgi:MFS family permease
MATFSSNPQTDQTLQHSLKDSGAFAVMTGIGETYLSAFALFLGAGTAQIGLLSSVPPMLASLVQIFSAWLGHTLGHRKRIILVGATIQCLAWPLILLLPVLFPVYSVALLIVAVIIYFAGANLAAPQWSSLMGDIVPRRKRGRFFGMRTRLITALTFLSLMAGGLILHLFTEREQTLYGFILLFLVAVIARSVSIYHLARMHDPGGHVSAMELPASREWWARLRQSNFVRFSLFFALMQFAVAIASPFFTVYLLRDLDFSYLQFTLITGAAVLAQFLTLTQWGRISDVFGNRRILSVSGLIIPVLPILWTFSTNTWYLVITQALSGFCWAGFSLSAGNFLYDIIQPGRRLTYMAMHNVLASLGVFAGAILGGLLGATMPDRIAMFGIDWNWASPLYGIFILSTVIRLIVVGTFIPQLTEVRAVRPISFGQVIFRVTRVNALAGLVFDIIGSRPKK